MRLPLIGLGISVLEAKAGLYLNNAGTQSRFRLAEVRVVGIRLDSTSKLIRVAIQVEFVEEVVEVHAKLDFAVFADELRIGQAERLAERGVNVEVAGAAE